LPVNVSVFELAIGPATTIDDLSVGLHKVIDGVPASLRNGPILAYQLSMNRIFVAAFALGVALQALAQQLSEVPQSPDADDGKGSPSSSWSYAPRGEDVLWVSARNDHGSLGQYCNTEMHFCVWLLMLRGVACEEGGEHPVLLNTDRLATSQTIRCVRTVAGGGATFAFTNFEEIDDAVRSAEQLGIAIPEEGDSIVVTHFPLTGAVAALDRMREVLVERYSSEDAKNTPGGSNGKPSKTPARDHAEDYKNSV
jgi:hypothetical protein